METKEISITWQGRPETVTIKRMTYGERLKLKRLCRKILFVNNVQKVELDEERMGIEGLRMGIKSAPFKLDEASIKELPGDLAEMIYGEIDSFNTIDEEKKKNPAGNEAGSDNDDGREGNDGVLHTGEGNGNKTMGTGQDGLHDG